MYQATSEERQGKMGGDEEPDAQVALSRIEEDEMDGVVVGNNEISAKSVTNHGKNKQGITNHGKRKVG